MLATAGRPTQADRATDGQALAVALHGVEPRTFEHCRQLREWLAAHGVDAVTLLVIPAPDLHPFAARSPALTSWLRARTAMGDAVAQHGLAPRSTRVSLYAGIVRAARGRRRAEFDGLDRAETEARVMTGTRLLRDLEIDAAGFVAPAYAYTRALRAVLVERFEWFADAQSIVRATEPPLHVCARRPAARGPSRRARTASQASRCLRIDVFPSDLDSPRRLATLEALLPSSANPAQRGARRAVTYDELGRWSPLRV
jgi:predicted deacetylase